MIYELSYGRIDGKINCWRKNHQTFRWELVHVFKDIKEALRELL